MKVYVVTMERYRLDMEYCTYELYDTDVIACFDNKENADNFIDKYVNDHEINLYYTEVDVCSTASPRLSMNIKKELEEIKR